MPKFHVEVPHQLTAEEAKMRVERFAEALHSRYGEQVHQLDRQWHGDSLQFAFSTMGLKIAGDIRVEPQKLGVTGSLPLAAVVFRSKIESEIREQLARLVA